MYEITVKTHFDAAHKLVGYPGVCRRLHGHTFEVSASVQGENLNEVGIVYDFKELKEKVEQIISQFDHNYLNEIPPLDKINPTSENLSKFIYEKLKETLGDKVTLNWVKVSESPSSVVTYLSSHLNR